MLPFPVQYNCEVYALISNRLHKARISSIQGLHAWKKTLIGLPVDSSMIVIDGTIEILGQPYRLTERSNDHAINCLLIEATYVMYREFLYRFPKSTVIHAGEGAIHVLGKNQ